MHARVGTFENRDVSVVDELVGTVRSRVSAEGGILPAGRHLLLLESRGGRALSITFFESEDDLLAAGPVCNALEDGIPEATRGRRTSVRSWEVALDELGDRCEAARITSVDTRPWHIVELVYLVRHQFATEAVELHGWRGGVLLVDRGSGEVRTITFWESDDALRRSEIREAQLFIRVVAEAGATVSRVERYAVAVDSVTVAARAATGPGKARTASARPERTAQPPAESVETGTAR